MNLAKCSIRLWRSLELLIKITAGYIDIAADSEFKKNQNSTNSDPEYKPVEKIDKVSFLRSLHNLVENRATQIQTVHTKNKEIQIALSIQNCK